MAFLVYSHSCATNPQPTLEHFIIPPEETSYPLAIVPHFPPQFSLHCGQLRIYFLSPKICLFCIFHINGIIQNVPLCLASFTYQDVFKFHPCWSMYQYFIPFYVWVLFHCMDIPHFVYPFIHWWPFELFPFFWQLWSMLLCTFVYKFLCGHSQGCFEN